MKRTAPLSRPEAEADPIERRTRQQLAEQRRRKQHRAALNHARKYRGQPAG